MLNNWISSRFVSAVLLTGLVTWSALPISLAVAQQQSKPETVQNSDHSLPSIVSLRVRNDVVNRLQVPFRSVKITEYSRQTWTDGCLGLGKPEELCIQALVPGWRVAVSYANNTWFYRTDATGKNLRLEGDRNSSSLPSAVGDRLLQAAAQQLQFPVNPLQISQAQAQTWNGCLGLDPGIGRGCTKIAIPGWRVVVTHQQKGWVFHTNAEGTEVRLNKTASHGDIIPQFLAIGDRPPVTNPNIVFLAIRRGGLAGLHEETVLMADGRIMQSKGTLQPQEIKRLSTPEVQQFRQVLQQVQFANLNGLNYPATHGADYFTMTFSSPLGFTQYADLNQNQLPSALQRVIQTWETLAKP